MDDRARIERILANVIHRIFVGTSNLEIIVSYYCKRVLRVTSVSQPKVFNEMVKKCLKFDSF